MSIVKGLIAGFLTTLGISAQPAPVAAQQVAQARRLLQSVRWADRAWGIYLAARLHSDDLNNLLVEEFRTAALLRNALPYSEEYAFVLALFDGAIEATITVPAEILEPFEQNWTAPVVIMLARSGDSENSLLRLGDNSAYDAVWLATNNLLFERKSASWFARTLVEVPLTHTFTVTDPGSGGFGGGIGSGGVGCGGLGLISMPKGFPPIGLFVLSVTPHQGSTMLAHGPRAIYYDRTVVPTDKPTSFGPNGSPILNRESIRIGYIAELADLTVADVERLLHRYTSIQYRGPEELNREMEQAISAQQEDIRSLFQKIKVRGLAPTPGATMKIVPLITDLRQNATSPLPPATPREIALN